MPRLTDAHWRQIEDQYRIGQVGIRELARQFDVSPSTICKRAKRDDWTQDLSEQVRREAKAQLLREYTRANAVGKPGVLETREGLAGGNAPNARDLIKIGAANIVDLVRSHRSDIGSLRQIIERHLAALGAAAVNTEDAKEHYFVVNTIDALSRALERTVRLERQAFSMDDAPEEPKDSETLQGEIQAILPDDPAERRKALRNMAGLGDDSARD